MPQSEEKPRAQRRGGELASAIRAIKVDGSAVDAKALKSLALNLILDTDYDDETAAHPRVQLEALKLVHLINVDEKAGDGDKSGGFTEWLDKIRGARKDKEA